MTTIDRMRRFSSAAAAGLVLAGLVGCNTSLDDKGSDEVPDAAAPPAMPVRVLVAYTAEAWDSLTTEGVEPLAHAAYRIELANLAFSNSGVSHVVELAGTTQLSSEATIFADPICAGKDGRKCGSKWLADGLEAGDFPIRDSLEADVVMLVMTDDEDGEYAGYARGTPSHTTPFERACATIEESSTLGFVHELGHLFGAHHDRYIRDEPIEVGINYGDTFTTIRSRTIMAYSQECEDLLGDASECSQIAWFTNPSVFINGVAIGNTSMEFNACRAQHFGPIVGTYYEIRNGELAYPAPPLITSCPFTLPANYDVGGLHCPGDYDVAQEADFADVEGCGTIQGDLTITAEDIASLERLSGLVEVGGDLVIESSATSLDGLDSLRSVGGLEIRSPVESLGPLADLVEAGTIEIEDADIVDLDGLRNVRVLSELEIRGCHSLLSLQGFPSAVTALDALRIVGNSDLENLEGAQHLRNLGTLEVTNNQSLTHLVLPWQEGQWLETLQRLEVTDNPYLWTLQGLWELQTISDGIVLEHNPQLGDLEELSNVEIAGELVIDLVGMGDLMGLRRLNWVDGEVHITNNPFLTTTEHMELLMFASYIDVSGNPFLPACDFPALMDGVLLYCDVGQPF